MSKQKSSVDISKRRQAQRSMDELFRALVENAMDVITIIDAGGVTRYQSPSVERALGYKPAELIGVNTVELLHPDDAPKMIAAMQTAALTGTPEIWQVRTRHKDGSWRMMEGIVNVLDISSMMGVVVNSRDITERKRAEEALRESEERYKRITEGLTDYLYTVSVKDGKAIETIHSETCFAITDTARKNFWTIPISGLTWLSRRKGNLWQKGLQIFLKVKNSLPSLHRIRRKDGEIRWIVDTAMPKYNSSGVLISYDGVVKDITERKQSEESLKLFRSLIEQSNDAIEVIDPATGRFLDANEKACTDLGYSREELLSLKVPDIDLMVDESVFKAIVEELQKSGSTIFESQHRRKDGSNFPVEVNVKYVLHEGNYLVSVARDITERKRAEEQLQLFRRLLDQSADAIFTVDAATSRFLDVNEKACLSMQYSREELLQRGVLDIQTAMRDTIDWQAHIEELRAKGKLLIEFEALRKDGTCFPVEVNTQFIETEGKTYIISVVRDITERKQAEEALRKSEERYKRIAEGLTDYLFTVSVKDGEAVETIHSEACFSITGYTSKEFADDPNLWINMVVPEEREFVEKRAGNILTGKEQPPIEHRIRHKDGKIRWVMDTTIPKFDAAGRLISYDGVIQDITNSKQAELLLQKKNEELAAQNVEKEKQAAELMIAKEKAEESDRLKSAFLANISHEIRTPMNGILGFAEILKAPDLTGEQQQEYIITMEKCGARMLNIIDDIVDLSKIESGHINVSVSETNVNKLLNDIYTFFRPEAEQKGLQLYYKNALPDNEAIIKTDRSKLFSILTNLVKNAIKFTSQGSIEFGYSSTLRPAQSGAGSLTDGSPTEPTFFVKDTGIGIRPEHKEIIFERFRQVGESLSRDYQGAGLGLAISKAYVEMLGGQIWVEGQEGKGSTFYFTLPYNATITFQNL